jgi:hypothetical protein
LDSPLETKAIIYKDKSDDNGIAGGITIIIYLPTKKEA